jgi:nucleotide-binding universal stress UspA family protein
VAARKWPKGTRVTVLAVSEFLLRMGDLSMALAKALGNDGRESAWPWMDSRLAIAVGKLEAAGLKARSVLAIGETRRTLLDQAKRFKADTVVMGSHGFTGFRRLMLGSISAAVAAHAPCSVEIIHLNRKRVRK